MQKITTNDKSFNVLNALQKHIIDFVHQIKLE